MPVAKRTTIETPTPMRRRGSKIWPGGKITKSLVTDKMVEKRARQLALIAGRRAGQVNDSDREDARRELLEPIHPTSRPSEKPFPAGSPWGGPPTSTGHRTRRIRPIDDQITKELVEEGVDEAEHDQMVRARKAGK